MKGKKPEHSKEIVLIATTLLMGAKAKAEYLNIECVPNGLNSSSVWMGHINGATEGYDMGLDSMFFGTPNPTIDFYFKTNLSAPHDKLDTNLKGPNSTTDYLMEIVGRGIGGTRKVNLNFSFFDDGQGHFDWKNLIVELYNEGDISNPANKLGTYDADRLANGTQSIPRLDVHEGLSYQLVVKPRNYADLDLNNRVNFKDHAILANKWQATGQGEESTWGNYANIDRDLAGNVDMDDLSVFVNEWLWIADHLQEGGSQAKATPILKGQYLKAFQEAMAKNFYGKEKAAQLREEALSNRRVQLARNYIRDIDPRLLERKSNLRNMLELSNNSRNGHLPEYETIDQELHNNPNRAFLASQGRKMLYKAA